MCRSVFILAIVASMLLGFVNAPCQADLMFHLKQAGGGVELFWTGTGTAAATTDTSLDFNAFSGSIFNTTGVFDLSVTLPMVSTDTMGGVFFSAYNKLEITTGNGFRVFSDTGTAVPLVAGNVYNALESFDPLGIKLVVLGLNPSDINVGSYTSTAGDSAAFGAVSLSVTGTAVPEPKTVVSCILLLTLTCSWSLRAARLKPASR